VNPPDAAVVVVGAGPVGLVAACELARRRVSVRVIDKLSAPTAESRAIAVHARSLEMFDIMGLLDELAASGVKATQMEMYADGHHLAHVEFSHVDSAFPVSPQCAAFLPCAALCEHGTGALGSRRGGGLGGSWRVPSYLPPSGRCVHPRWPAERRSLPSLGEP
jgi:threonine dehydrogenase-like Zn-dependent dehydrogenase